LRALEILEHEVLTTMALMGVSDVKDLHPGLLEKVPPVTPAHVLSAFPLLEEGY
ncbi:MAG: alpha-hydroxy-acid oxidizing protein, partial [Proteobacteria bacterium]|nr:alpha-hydroxy-acid oxidizing protein [Pseudomonadota bacterium]